MIGPNELGLVRRLLREIRGSEGAAAPVAVGGARELATVLSRELGRGGDERFVRVGAPEGASVYVHIATGDDEAALKRARRARVPTVAVAEPGAELPFVLATHVVPLRPGEPLPVDEIVAVIAAAVGDDGAPLAARLPALRGAVCERIVATYARRNGIIGAAVFVPGVDMPLLTLNQLRMVLRLDQAHGLQPNPRERLPEILGTVAAGLGLRTVARELLDLVPVAGWVVKGGVAYAGTRALGEAAVKRLEYLH